MEPRAASLLAKNSALAAPKHVQLIETRAMVSLWLTPLLSPIDMLKRITMKELSGKSLPLLERNL